MPLSLSQQYDAAISNLSVGDFNNLTKVLTAPDSITPDENRSVASRLGFKGPFLETIVNVATDPLVWVAMFLSRRFPTRGFVTGEIPKRFIGAANDFTGLSYFTRPVADFFRGTNIPNLVNLRMQREGEVMKVGNRIFDELLTRPNWKNEMPVVSLLMEGRIPAGATPELTALSQRIRGHMNELWGFLGKTHKVDGGFDAGDTISRATARPFTPSEAPQYLRDYLPHIPLIGTKSTIDISGREALAKFANDRTAQALELARENPAQVWSVDKADRLASNFERYQSFLNRTQGQVFNPRIFRRQREGIALQSADGRDLFVTDLNVILQKYVHSVARTYALNAPLTDAEVAIASSRAGGRLIAPTKDPIIVQIINEGMDSAGGKYAVEKVAGTNIVRERLIPGSVNVPSLGALKTLVRSVRGDLGTDEILFGNLTSSILHKMHTTLGPVLPKKLADKIASAAVNLKDVETSRSLQSGITSYFYASTLGLNARSAFKNLFQPALTTVPALGIGPTLAGYRELGARMRPYFSEFVRQRKLLSANPQLGVIESASLALEKAFETTFPELSRSGIRIDPRAFELSEGALTQSLVSGKVGMRGLDSFYKFVMGPFTASESANQIVTFYGAKQALKNAARLGEFEIPVGPELLDGWLNSNAAGLVNATQFRPTPGSRSMLQSVLPAPFRMFTHFPQQMLNYFTSSMVRGALTDEQLKTAGTFAQMTGGRNLGTIARTYVAGRAVAEGMKNALGIDISDAVGLSGPFSGVAPQGSTIIPMPNPPLFSTLYGIASYATTRDLRQLQPLELPGIGPVPIPKTLVPGGVAVSRAARAIRQFRPDLGGFTDDDERLMYQAGTSDLVLGMLGIPLDKDRRLRQDIEQLEGNRQRMREYRRGFVRAHRNADTAAMDQLRAGYSEEFPESGPLTVTDKDLRRYDQAARISAVQRMLQSMGSSGSYLEANYYEHDPDFVVHGAQ